jgi:hypothetical protein
MGLEPMRDLLDYELQRTEDPLGPAPDEQDRKPGLWIAAVVLLGFAAAVYVVYGVYGRRAPAPAPAPAAARAAEAPRPAGPLGGLAEPIEVPPLDESDPLVRELVRKVTSHPSALAWLATNGLIRNFTVVVANVVEGQTPAQHLRVLRPSSPFRVVQPDGRLWIDTRSYSRYDALADAAASIDPAGAARLYATLKPRLEEAYAELGTQPASFDRALERAIVMLLQTPAVDGAVRVEPKGIGYRFADSNLEQLTPAQKQLLRTGPRNVRLVQSSLRRLALALGVAPERLP